MFSVGAVGIQARNEGLRLKPMSLSLLLSAMGLLMGDRALLCLSLVSLKMVIWVGVGTGTGK